jgi:hypothetical protein
VIPNWYLFWAPYLPDVEEFEALLADLGIEAEVIGTSWEYYVISEARSGVQIVAEVDRLHQALGSGAYSEYGSYGCPSGGGGGGGGGPLGVLEIPSLSDLSLLLFAAVLAAIGVVRARSG